MDDNVFVEAGEEMESEDGRGIGFGSALHEFAEDHVNEVDVTPSNTDERRVKEFIDGLDGELFTEEWARLPLEVDGERVTISGFVDLVHVTPDRVEIIDYKTDLSRQAEEEYRKQLSVYYHVLASEHEDRKVTTSIYYTAQDEHVPLPPHSIEELRDVVRESRE